ncbi:MAG TPA: type II secretion system F family protein [Rhodocyclaceae bacterium]|nr:type II secretion system F family protein [Rhodocyclaceae bacterium]
MHWLLLVALLLAGACVVLLRLLRRQEWQDSRRRFEEVLAAEEDAAWLAESFHAGEEERKPRVLRRLSRLQAVELELRRAGWSAPLARRIYFAAAALGPIAGMVAAGAWAVVSGADGNQVVAAAFLGFGTGYLLPPRVLRWQVERRRKVLRDEMLAVLHLLRMLFDAGLSMEHALRIVSEQGRALVPQMAAELGIALVRINAGQDRAEALEEMAAPLGVPELDDTVAILKQATRYGGSLRDSLTRFTLLIEERRMTSLREYVSKLSAKMTIVMVVFMFPALTLFLAGPGFLALIRALMRVNS